MQTRTQVILIAALVTLGLAATAVANSTYKGFPTAQVVVNGQLLNPDVPAIIIEGRTLLPVRAVAEALGATLEWDDATKTVTIFPAERTKLAAPNAPVVYINGQPRPELSAVLYGSVVMVPLDEVTKVLAVEWAYDPESKFAIVRNGSNSLLLQAGGETARLNGTEITVDQGLLVLNNQTFVPIQLVLESFGLGTYRTVPDGASITLP